MDSGEEVSSLFESVDAMRADLAEFRHETHRELGRINTRLDGCATKADVQALRIELKDAMLAQTRWILAGLVTVVLAIYFRT